jgi:hypothetical protein
LQVAQFYKNWKHKKFSNGVFGYNTGETQELEERETQRKVFKRLDLML